MIYKILSVNPGSTSTKFAYYENENLLYEHTIRHSTDELRQYKRILDQYEFRKEIILGSLQEKGISLADLSVVVGRGGLLRPIESGIYEVNDKMIEDLKAAVGGEHASNLGAIIAHEIAEGIPNCRAFISDPVVVDELQDVARVSGLPQIPRRSTFHALNHKNTGKKYAKEKGGNYEDYNLIIAHLGGGVSVAAHQKGKVIDTNQALDGFGPFSPERSGTLDAGQLVAVCFEGKRTKEEIKKLLAGQGGMVAHLGTQDVKEVLVRIEAGDEYAKLVLEAMAYGVAKSIGEMHAVLKGKTDAILLTGGIAYCDFVVDYIKDMLSTFAPIVVYPGENELEALALCGLEILRGGKSKLY